MPDSFAFYFSLCYKSFFLTSAKRIRLLRLTGIHIWKCYFIGHLVLFDDLYPGNIFIGDATTVTSETKIITHLYNLETASYDVDEVHIGNNCFIGMNTSICKLVVIGNNTCVGRGTVIIKDLPENTVCARVPCKVIWYRISGDN